MIALDDLTETTLATFYLAVRLPGGDAGRLTEIQDALIEGAGRTSGSGRQVRYLHGIYIPARNCLLCAFVADSREAVHAAAKRARLPFAPIDGRLTSRPAGARRTSAG